MKDLHARSMTFFDNWDGTGKFSFALEDGSHIYITVTPTMTLLANSQLSEFNHKQFGGAKRTEMPEAPYP